MDIPQDDLDYLNQVTELAGHPVFDQAMKMGVPVTQDLLQKLAVQAAKPLPFSKGLVSMDTPTGGKVNIDAATREIINPSNIVTPPKPLPGSMGVFQEQLPDGTLINRDKATGEKIIGEAPRTPTDSQGNAMMFSNRMKQANEIISGIPQEQYNPTGFMDTFSHIPNRLQSEARQQYNTAAANWISAALRKESGAAISASEYEEGFKQYFPLPGDKPAVVEQKAKLRDRVTADMSKLGGVGFAGSAGSAVPAGGGMQASPVPAAGGLPIGSRGMKNGQWYRKTANGWEAE